MKKLLLVLLLLIVAAPAIAKDVTLSWDASPSDGVTGYKVQAATDAAMTQPVEGFPRDVGDVLTATFNDLPSETGHYFTVTAYNAVTDESGPSNQVYSPGFTKPDPPQALGGTTTVNNVDVTME